MEKGATRLEKSYPEVRRTCILTKSPKAAFPRLVRKRLYPKKLDSFVNF